MNFNSGIISDVMQYRHNLIPRKLKHPKRGGLSQKEDVLVQGSPTLFRTGLQKRHVSVWMQLHLCMQWAGDRMHTTTFVQAAGVCACCLSKWRCAYTLAHRVCRTIPSPPTPAGLQSQKSWRLLLLLFYVNKKQAICTDQFICQQSEALLWHLLCTVVSCWKLYLTAELHCRDAKMGLSSDITEEQGLPFFVRSSLIWTPWWDCPDNRF